MASGNAWSNAENNVFEFPLLQSPEEEPRQWRSVADCLPDNFPDGVAAPLLNDVSLIESGGVKLPNCRARLRAKSERKKRALWTIEEQWQFLIGLEIYGRGDWRSISRHCVKSRTPTQIASHAQKYFKRRELHVKDRKRCSIHDITIPQMSNAHDFSSSEDGSFAQQVPATTHSTVPQWSAMSSNDYNPPVVSYPSFDFSDWESCLGSTLDSSIF